jgi:hypothetical protein
MGSVTCMAIDWISRCLFWADNTGASIQVIKLDGPVHYQKVLLAGAGKSDVSVRVANPSSLAVDPINGLEAMIFCSCMSVNDCRINKHAA